MLWIWQGGRLLRDSRKFIMKNSTVSTRCWREGWSWRSKFKWENSTASALGEGFQCWSSNRYRFSSKQDFARNLLKFIQERENIWFDQKNFLNNFQVCQPHHYTMDSRLISMKGRIFLSFHLNFSIIGINMHCKVVDRKTKPEFYWKNLPHSILNYY